MLRDTKNLWRIDHTEQGWKVTYFQESKSFDCGSPNRADTPLHLVLEWVEFNAKPNDLVSVQGSVYQIGRPRAIA